jgi:hypothetical protein
MFRVGGLRWRLVQIHVAAQPETSHRGGGGAAPKLCIHF